MTQQTLTDYIGKALSALRPNAEFSVVDGVISWVDAEQTQPSQTEIDAKVAELQTAQPLDDLRTARNKRLLDTDWMANQDRTMSQAERDYRQALRDITNTYTSLDTVVWPTKP